MIKFKVFDSKCWWCDSSDLSAEHKYKRTDLEREYFSKANALTKVVLCHLSDLSKPGKYIQSSKSKYVKFNSNLCKSCNGNKSQVFDMAYDKLIEFLTKNESKTLINPDISLIEIYGEVWQLEKENLIKYFVKNLGCALCESNIKVPENLINFLNDKENLINFELKISQSTDRKRYLDLMVKETYPASWIGRSDVQICISRSTGIINFFHYELYYRSFSFYLKLGDTHGFQNNFSDHYLNLILYSEDVFKKINNYME